MGRPVYAALAAAYPRHPKDGIPHSGIDQAELYSSIGHQEFAHDQRMQNTCAMRMSIALMAAGIHPAPGNLTVTAGRFAGLRVETAQKALSNFLRRRLGPPEVYKSGFEVWNKIKPHHGIVSFFHLLGGDWDPQGHIDLVEPANMSDLKCASSCYWSSTKVWFWPLK